MSRQKASPPLGLVLALALAAVLAFSPRPWPHFTSNEQETQPGVTPLTLLAITSAPNGAIRVKISWFFSSAAALLNARRSAPRPREKFFVFFFLFVLVPTFVFVSTRECVETEAASRRLVSYRSTQPAPGPSCKHLAAACADY